MAWIAYRKGYEVGPRSWIVEYMMSFGVGADAQNFLVDSVDSWKAELTSSGDRLDVQIGKGMFQGDSLSPLLFVSCMILRGTRRGYEWGHGEFKINRLLFMDGFKLFGKTHEETDSLVQTVHTSSQDIGMEFGFRKCGALMMRNGKT